MPRYFFHLAAGTRRTDFDGTELADLNAARREAVVYVSEILRDRPDEIWAGAEMRVDVTDEQGFQLFTLVVLGFDGPAAPRTMARPSPRLQAE